MRLNKSDCCIEEPEESEDEWMIDNREENEVIGYETINEPKPPKLEAIKPESFGKEKLKDEASEKQTKLTEIDRGLNFSLRGINKRHAVIIRDGKCLILNEDKTKDGKVVGINYSSVSDFHNRYAPYKFDTGDKQVPLTKLWFDWPDRRIYHGVYFHPGQNSSGQYNLWTGFTVEPKRGDWGLFQEFIFDIICNSVDKIYNWLLARMAKIVQDPGGKKPGTCIALRGPQGSGKGTLVSIFGKPFGQHFCHVSNESYLTGRFNRHLATSVLVYLDEALFEKRLQSTAGTLKALITEPRLLMEEKYMTPKMVDNFLNIIIAGNSEWVVPAGIGERRFAVLDVSSKRKGDHKYFQRIYNQMDEKGLAAMLYDLLRWPVSRVNLRSIPKTSALFEQVIKNFNSIESFWFDCLSKKQIFENKESSHGSKDNLYFAYGEFCIDQKIRKVNKGLFWKQFKKVCKYEEYRPRKDNPERKYLYKLPSIGECRNHFSNWAGMSINWGEYE